MVKNVESNLVCPMPKKKKKTVAVDKSESTESLDTKSLGDGDKPDRVPDSNGGVGERLKVEWMIRP